MYKHYVNTKDNNYGVFYEVSNPSSIKLIVNSNPSTRKVFKTINYEGDNGWKVSSLQTDITKVNVAPNTNASDLSDVIYSYEEGLYTDPVTGYPQRAGFVRKENLYTASIKNNSLFQNDQILSSNSVTGLKGYVLDVEVVTDETTDPKGPKELWSIGTSFVQSS